MAAPLAAELLGGTPFLGFIAAVAFATILAVVAGLTLAGASALSHDIFVHVVRRGHATDHEQVRVARAARRSCSARWRSSWALSSRARTSPSWSVWRLRSPAARTSRRCCSRLSGSGSRRPAPSARSSPGPLLSVLLIVLSPTVWVDLLHNAHGDLPAAQSRHRLDAGGIPRRDRRLAGDARADRGGDVRRREDQDLSGCGGGVEPSRACPRIAAGHGPRSRRDHDDKLSRRR